MPGERRKDYEKAGILPINIEKIIANKDISDYFENFLDINLVIASNLLLGDIQSYLNKNSLKIEDTKLTKEKFRELVNKLDKKEINNKIFKDILTNIMESDKDIETILNDKGLNISFDEDLLNSIIDNVLNNNEKIISDYKNGNERSAKALMGLIMKEGKGKVDPAMANKKLMEKLNNLWKKYY